MKTTLVINDQVFLRLKQEAVRQRKTMSELVEAGVRLLFERKGTEKTKKLPPLPSFDGGRCLVNVANRDALYRAMEEENY